MRLYVTHFHEPFLRLNAPPRKRRQPCFGVLETHLSLPKAVFHAQLLQCFTFSDLDSKMLRKAADGSAPPRAEHIGGSGYFPFRCFWSLKYPNIAPNRAASIVCTLHRRVLKMGLHTCVSHLLIAFLLQTQHPVCGSSTGSISL